MSSDFGTLKQNVGACVWQNRQNGRAQALDKVMLLLWEHGIIAAMRSLES
jgi:hypothetical protein